MGDAQQLIQTIVVGLLASLVPLITLAVKRRPEIRNLDADADAKAVTASGVAMDSLERAVRRADDRVTALEKQLHEERVASTRQLNAAHAEIGRLGGQVAGVRTDLAIANGRIEQLQMRLIGSLPDDTAEVRRPP